MTSKKFNFKNYFIAGLIAILPLWLTVSVLMIAFNWISGSMAPVINPIFKIAFGPEERKLIVHLVSFFVTVFLIWFVGFLTTRLVGRRFLLWMESHILKVPLLRDVYLAFRQLFQSLFVQKKAFRKVVLVEFPLKDHYVLGFVTMDAPKEFRERMAQNLVTVFIPHVPNITSGFLLYINEDKLIPTTINIDDALKLIISGGVIRPEDKTLENAPESGADLSDHLNFRL
jgi:uncharacterized membrane protein